MLETVNLNGAQFFYHDETPCLKVAQERYELESESFDSLLTLLKIPTKYLYRFAAEDPEQASKNVNFWLEKKCGELSLAVKGNEVIRVVESSMPFVPVKSVIDALTEYWGKEPFVTTEGDLTVALFGTDIPEVELASGETAFISIRLTYSECFMVMPKLDAVLTVNGSYENYYHAIRQHKFRALGMESTHIINQVIEFSDIVCEQIQKEFIPALDKMIGYNAQLNIYGFVERLCSELRLSKRICRALLEGIEGPEMELHLLTRKIGNNLLSEVRDEDIDYITAREIEIALSKAIVSGRFK